MKLIFYKSAVLILIAVCTISCFENKTVIEKEPIVSQKQPKVIASDAIIKAIDSENYQLVEALLSSDEDSNAIAPGYFRGGREDGPDDNSNQDWTLLMYASYHKNFEVVKLLLAHGADINAVNAAGHSPLFLACANRDEEMARFLLEHNADVKMAGSDKSGISALQWALSYEWNGIARIMIEAGADLNSRSTETGDTLLLVAMQGDSIQPEIIHLLIDKGANVKEVNSKYKTAPLMIACRKNDIISVKKILAQGGGINQEDDTKSTALCFAAGNDTDNTELLELLVKNGAKVNLENLYVRNALIEAADSKSIKKVKYLLQKGALINRKSEGFGGVSALSVAVFDVNFEMVDFLIKNGADVSSEIGSGKTVLLEAILAEESYPIVQLLIEKGVDVNRADGDNKTPLMKAAQYNLPQIVKLLLDSGAHKQGTDNYRKTALQYAEETFERTGEDAVLKLIKN